ncbi:hypothetical protein L1987_09215 [Smallanthus sonchifolius]|uniref:Uncharacterized protein n=1 Tax=Smallanthus sonchifolius TaxID=185202 RepID=A0ACB9JNE0_9ASTR|nr:hypothetical protein L1987_09215 [Smallanthus sonchifolius]
MKRMWLLKVTDGIILTLSEHSDEEDEANDVDDDYDNNDEDDDYDDNDDDNDDNDDDEDDSDGDEGDVAVGYGQGPGDSDSEKTVTDSSDSEHTPDQRHPRIDIQESLPESSTRRRQRPSLDSDSNKEAPHVTERRKKTRSDRPWQVIMAEINARAQASTVPEVPTQLYSRRRQRIIQPVIVPTCEATTQSIVSLPATTIQLTTTTFHPIMTESTLVTTTTVPTILQTITLPVTVTAGTLPPMTHL